MCCFYRIDLLSAAHEKLKSTNGSHALYKRLWLPFLIVQTPNVTHYTLIRTVENVLALPQKFSLSKAISTKTHEWRFWIGYFANGGNAYERLDFFSFLS